MATGSNREIFPVKIARHTKAEKTALAHARLVLEASVLSEPLRMLLIHRLAERKTWVECGELLQKDILSMPDPDAMADAFNRYIGAGGVTVRRAQKAFRDAADGIRQWTNHGKIIPFKPQRRRSRLERDQLSFA